MYESDRGKCIKLIHMDVTVMHEHFGHKKLLKLSFSDNNVWCCSQKYFKYKQIVLIKQWNWILTGILVKFMNIHPGNFCLWTRHPWFSMPA